MASSKAPLAARYRPQTFAQVVGQDMVKAILSRAASEDRVAPAYLLSGTRGVGKTTLARIFAKALNCAQAPTGEPCNQCEACRRITQGSFVDVVEIDGASNRGIDDVRRLRDAVTYSSMEGRYKVFIIDEAHMLTKEAFNALLKTLEEPPPRVTFIMATTEQHKFPVTIVSRCQHFVFRQIPEAVLEAHIRSVLQQENQPFEDDAALLIARRAAGSVRDAMSLLGQTLALGEDDSGILTAAQAREVLGLAGQDIMERLLTALAHHDSLAVALLVRELLSQGADMGFFLRELGGLWRNLFLLHQVGAKASAALDMPPKEAERLLTLAPHFSLTYIHAAWQMTLDAQRRILTSLEPAAALELLLLNLAVLPSLLPLPELSAEALPQNQEQNAGVAPRVPPVPPVPSVPLVEAKTSPGSANAAVPTPSAAPVPASVKPVPPAAQPSVNSAPPWNVPEAAPARASAVPAAVKEAEPLAPSRSFSPGQVPIWSAFLDFCATQEDSLLSVSMLRQFSGSFDLSAQDGSAPTLRLGTESQALHTQLSQPPLSTELSRLAALWLGQAVELTFAPVCTERKTEAEWKEELKKHEVVQALEQAFDASLLRCPTVK